MLGDADEPMQPADGLNLDYDSDDSSMQVDSDSPPNNHLDHDIDADADADVDADGDSIHVSSPGVGGPSASTTAGPSSYAHHDSVRLYLAVPQYPYSFIVVV